MPTGGAAIMREGKNLLKLARKEQVREWMGRGMGGGGGEDGQGRSRTPPPPPAPPVSRPLSCLPRPPHTPPSLPPPPTLPPPQCLALLNQLRSKFKATGEFYRVFPNGEVQYLHPKDGTVPERVNASRKPINTNLRRIGDNTNPSAIKFTGKGTFDV